jgi:hypothetical protein
MTPTEADDGPHAAVAATGGIVDVATQLIGSFG